MPTPPAARTTRPGCGLPTHANLLLVWADRGMMVCMTVSTPVLLSHSSEKWMSTRAGHMLGQDLDADGHLVLQRRAWRSPAG